MFYFVLVIAMESVLSGSLESTEVVLSGVEEWVLKKWLILWLKIMVVNIDTESYL